MNIIRKGEKVFCLLLLGICIALISVGCGNKTVPEKLRGKWVTSNPRYRDCTLVLERESIIFTKEPDIKRVNRIIDIEKSTELYKTLYKVKYVDEQDQEFHLSFYYLLTPRGGMIQFKNQKELLWKKKDMLEHQGNSK